MKNQGEWIIVFPTDCRTLIPVYQCSTCKNLTSGYAPKATCADCGSVNKIANDKFVELAIFSEKVQY